MCKENKAFTIVIDSIAVVVSVAILVFHIFEKK